MQPSFLCIFYKNGRKRLEIAYLHSLAHFDKALLKLRDYAHLQVEAYGQVGVLVSGIYSASDEEIDVGGLLK